MSEDCEAERRVQTLGRGLMIPDREDNLFQPWAVLRRAPTLRSSSAARSLGRGAPGRQTHPRFWPCGVVCAVCCVRDPRSRPSCPPCKSAQRHNCRCWRRTGACGKHRAASRDALRRIRRKRAAPVPEPEDASARTSSASCAPRVRISIFIIWASFVCPVRAAPLPPPCLWLSPSSW